MRRTVLGRSRLLSRQLLGEEVFDIIFKKAESGDYEFSAKELTTLRRKLCKEWKK